MIRTSVMQEKFKKLLLPLPTQTACRGATASDGLNTRPGWSAPRCGRLRPAGTTAAVASLVIFRRTCEMLRQYAKVRSRYRPRFRFCEKIESEVVEKPPSLQLVTCDRVQFPPPPPLTDQTLGKPRVFSFLRLVRHHEFEDDVGVFSP